MRQSQQSPNIYHRYRNVILYIWLRLNHVGTITQNTDNSQIDIAQGKTRLTQTKKLVCLVAFPQLHIMCTQIRRHLSPNMVDFEVHLKWCI